MSLKIRGKIYKTVVSFAMLYKVESLASKKSNVKEKMNVAKINKKVSVEETRERGRPR